MRHTYIVEPNIGKCCQTRSECSNCRITHSPPFKKRISDEKNGKIKVSSKISKILMLGVSKPNGKKLPAGMMWHFFPINVLKAAVMCCWCIAGAFFNPIGMTSHLYSPSGIVLAVRCTWSGCILIWKKLLVMSMVAQIFPLAQSLSMSSIWGRGWLSDTVFSFSWW